MLATQLRPEHFTPEITSATSDTKTLAGWLYHFFDSEPDATIEAIIEAVKKLGINPQTEEVCTDQYLAHMTPEQLYSIWYVVVIPLVSGSEHWTSRTSPGGQGWDADRVTDARVRLVREIVLEWAHEVVRLAHCVRDSGDLGHIARSLRAIALHIDAPQAEGSYFAFDDPDAGSRTLRKALQFDTEQTNAFDNSVEPPGRRLR